MSGNNKNTTLAFTLPISCQICLGKVKQPVVCPNQHVFCKVCMEFWLDRSQHCPACRVQITPENPCRPVLGGLSQQNDENPERSTREMRRTRMEVLFKEYEGEIEKLQRQNEILEEENKILSESLSKKASGTTQYSEVDQGHLRILTKKLKEMTELYDKVKKEVKSLKQENHLLKEENGKQGIENQKLRMEVVSRSPRRFGRSTVLAMETQLEKYKKENLALQKALEKTDAYIEDLEKHLQQYKDAASKQKKAGNKDKVQQGYYVEGDSFLNSDDSEEYKSKRPTKSTCNNDTFDFEMPSPMLQSKSIRNLSIDTTNDECDTFLKGIDDAKKNLFDDTLESKDDTLELPSPVQNAKKKLKFSEHLGNDFSAKQNNINDNFTSSNQLISSRDASNQLSTNSSRGFTNQNSIHTSLVQSKTLQANLIQSNVHSNTMKVDLNTSMTPDIEDCMKIFEEAERKVEIRKSIAPGSGCGDYMTNHQNADHALKQSAFSGVQSALISSGENHFSSQNSMNSLSSGQRSSLHTGLASSMGETSNLIATNNRNFSASLQPGQTSSSTAIPSNLISTQNRDEKLFDPRRTNPTEPFPTSFPASFSHNSITGKEQLGRSNGALFTTATGVHATSGINAFHSSQGNFKPFMSQSTSNVSRVTSNDMRGPSNYNLCASTTTVGRSLSQDYGTAAANNAGRTNMYNFS